MAVRSSSLASLARAIRLADLDGFDLGRYIAEQREVLAPLLGVAPEKLLAAEGMPNLPLAAQFKVLLRRRAEEQEQRHSIAAQLRVEASVAQIVQTARWRFDVLHIEAELLLGDLLADARQKYVGLVADGVFDVAVHRQKLAEVGRVLRKRADLIAFVDAAGFHVRWRDGRAGLNFFSHEVPRADRDRVITLAFHGPPVVTRRDVTRSRRPPAWLGEVLFELATR